MNKWLVFIVVLVSSTVWAFTFSDLQQSITDKSKTLKLTQIRCTRGSQVADLWCGTSDLAVALLRLQYGNTFLKNLGQKFNAEPLIDWYTTDDGLIMRRVDIIENGKLTVEIYGKSLPVQFELQLEVKNTGLLVDPNSPDHKFLGAETTIYYPARADLDCKDFPNQATAQLFFDTLGGISNDPHRLDADKDGVPCEVNKVWSESGLGGLGIADASKIPTRIVAVRNVANPTPIIAPTPPTPPPSVTPAAPPSNGLCWVNGYRRKDGTWVNGYWRKC
jgi:Excalibur calcium-binding domain